jgi:solute carrier family 25 folate transporter 32
MGIMDIIRLIARTDGFRGFYRGLAVNLTRTVPSSAMTILT